jgi:rhodanese-related sulfurtransferase
VIPLLNLFRELAPLLAGRVRYSKIPIGGTESVTTPSDHARSRIRELSPGELVKLRQLPLIVDVRAEEEFSSGHIKDATNVRRDSLEMIISEIAPDRSRPILVYCAVGNSGALAADSLQRMGYLNVFSLKGGLASWLEAGGLLETRKMAK